METPSQRSWHLLNELQTILTNETPEGSAPPDFGQNSLTPDVVEIKQPINSSSLTPTITTSLFEHSPSSALGGQTLPSSRAIASALADAVAHTVSKVEHWQRHAELQDLIISRMMAELRKAGINEDYFSSTAYSAPILDTAPRTIDFNVDSNVVEGKAVVNSNISSPVPSDVKLLGSSSSISSNSDLRSPDEIIDDPKKGSITVKLTPAAIELLRMGGFQPTEIYSPSPGPLQQIQTSVPNDSALPRGYPFSPSLAVSVALACSGHPDRLCRELMEVGNMCRHLRLENLVLHGILDSPEGPLGLKNHVESLDSEETSSGLNSSRIPKLRTYRLSASSSLENTRSKQLPSPSGGLHRQSPKQSPTARISPNSVRNSPTQTGPIPNLGLVRAKVDSNNHSSVSLLRKPSSTRPSTRSSIPDSSPGVDNGERNHSTSEVNSSLKASTELKVENQEGSSARVLPHPIHNPLTDIVPKLENSPPSTRRTSTISVGEKLRASQESKKDNLSAAEAARERIREFRRKQASQSGPHPKGLRTRNSSVLERTAASSTLAYSPRNAVPVLSSKEVLDSRVKRRLLGRLSTFDVDPDTNNSNNHLINHSFNSDEHTPEANEDDDDWMSEEEEEILLPDVEGEGFSSIIINNIENTITTSGTRHGDHIKSRPSTSSSNIHAPLYRSIAVHVESPEPLQRLRTRLAASYGSPSKVINKSLLGVSTDLDAGSTSKPAGPLQLPLDPSKLQFLASLDKVIDKVVKK